jgi:Protein of unknown function (DUF4232)
MRSPARAVRALAAAAVLACSAALAAACGTAAAPAASPAASPAVTATPTVSAGTASPAVSPAPAPAPAPAAAAPACATSALKVAVPAGPGGAAAGSSYYPIQFANVSGASCTLYGYPGVSFVTAQGGRQIGPAATRNAAVARQLVTLSPGQTVHAELQVVNAQNYPPADCGLVTAHWLKIYPPNQTGPAYVSFTAQACAKPKQILSVETIQPGTAGP